MNKFDEALLEVNTWSPNEPTRQHIETIRTALTQAAEIERGDKVVVDGWKSIESAPKSGGFIAYSPGNHSSFTVYRVSGDDRFYILTIDNKRQHLNPYLTESGGPTHWMPLPQPPASEGK